MEPSNSDCRCFCLDAEHRRGAMGLHTMRRSGVSAKLVYIAILPLTEGGWTARAVRFWQVASPGERVGLDAIRRHARSCVNGSLRATLSGYVEYDDGPCPGFLSPPAPPASFLPARRRCVLRAGVARAREAGHFTRAPLPPDRNSTGKSWGRSWNWISHKIVCVVSFFLFYSPQQRTQILL